MGFTTEREYHVFLRQTPLVEETLIDSGFSSPSTAGTTTPSPKKP